MESRLQAHAPDGSLQGLDIYRLTLRCIPSHDTAQGDEYTCLRFTVSLQNGPELVIPALTNWSYLFKLTPDGRDKKGQVFGIDHSQFENLVDSKGHRIPVANSYHVYNAFIDFHSMAVFSEKTTGGGGIQDLKHIGDRVVHAAANSEAPVNLGSQVANGSYFRNGEVTLALKGLSLVNDKTCALVEYDSGESSFNMVVNPMPGVDVSNKGSSHYWGDIYKDLQTGWMQKAVLHEMVVSETAPPGMAPIHAVIERKIQIMNISGKTR
jgi:hypothetical protein